MKIDFYHTWTPTILLYSNETIYFVKATFIDKEIKKKCLYFYYFCRKYFYFILHLPENWMSWQLYIHTVHNLFQLVCFINQMKYVLILMYLKMWHSFKRSLFSLYLRCYICQRRIILLPPALSPWSFRLKFTFFKNIISVNADLTYMYSV